MAFWEDHVTRDSDVPGSVLTHDRHDPVNDLVIFHYTEKTSNILIQILLLILEFFPLMLTRTSK